MNARRSGSTGDQVPRSVSERLGAIFDAVGGDRDGFSAKDIVTLLPRTIDALRSLVRRDGDGARGIPIEKLRALGGELAPRLPVRDHPTLVRHHKGLIGEDLADVLVRNSSGSTAMAGVVGGSLVLATKSSHAVLLSVPIRLAAEALIVGAIEVKMIGELHEAYGRPLGTNSRERAQAAFRIWASYRGIESADAGSMVGLMGRVIKRPAQRRAAGGVAGKVLGRRGAILGAGIAGGSENRKETLALAEKVRTELRRGGIRRIGPAHAG